MTPGPKKSFDSNVALEIARDLFWERGFDGTGIRDLEAAIGIGRKSLYDTFGSKRELYLRAIEQYADTVIQRLCDGLSREGASPLKNLERVLRKLQEHHGGGASLGCLLGVAMGQALADDAELSAAILAPLDRLERAFEACLREAQATGHVRPEVQPRDAARNLLVLSQGMALLGRVGSPAARSSSAIRAALAALRPPSAP